MANVTFGGNLTIGFSAQGTRNSDGTQQVSVPGILAAFGMNAANTAFLDQGLLTTSQDDLDLTTLNLDGTGAKDLTGYYPIFIVVPVAGSGSGTLTVSSGTTNPYLGLPLSANGILLSQTVPARLAFGDKAVSAGGKTVDIILSGTLSYWLYVVARIGQYSY